MTHLPIEGVTADMQVLAEQYPDWKIWRSQDTDGTPGELMATRRRTLTMQEIAQGLAPTLPFGHRADLAEQLAEQAVRERQLGQCRGGHGAMPELTPLERIAAKATLLMSYLTLVPTERDSYTMPPQQIAEMEERAKDIRAQMRALDKTTPPTSDPHQAS